MCVSLLCQLLLLLLLVLLLLQFLPFCSTKCVGMWVCNQKIDGYSIHLFKIHSIVHVCKSRAHVCSPNHRHNHHSDLQNVTNWYYQCCYFIRQTWYIQFQQAWILHIYHAAELWFHIHHYPNCHQFNSIDIKVRWDEEKGVLFYLNFCDFFLNIDK